MIIKEKVHELLVDMASWPNKFASSDWFEAIDENLLPAGDRRDRTATGAEVKAEQERVKRRRAKKTETMRKLRAEGREERQNV